VGSYLIAARADGPLRPMSWLMAGGGGSFIDAAPASFIRRSRALRSPTLLFSQAAAITATSELDPERALHRP